ncbi:MAG: DUF4058 family protein [Planctomycetes bacterium]|nr:DUF4058 family protein [Planctomycetota bacterium]
MPLHDWTRVSANVFHSFHVGWLWTITRALNGGLLPAGYQARAEEYLGPFQSDVLTLETASGGGEPARGGAPGAAPVPTVVLAPPRFETWRERRVAVFSARDERRVAVVEVVSPGNKDSQQRAQFFRGKLLECLGAGLHLLVIDVLPATGVAPGFAAEVARDLGDTSGKVGPGGQAVTSFERRSDPLAVRIYHAALHEGQPLPAAPLFLLGDARVDLPLEATYLEAFEGLGRGDRDALVGRPPV